MTHKLYRVEITHIAYVWCDGEKNADKRIHEIVECDQPDSVDVRAVKAGDEIEGLWNPECSVWGDSREERRLLGDVWP